MGQTYVFAANILSGVHLRDVNWRDENEDAMKYFNPVEASGEIDNKGFGALFWSVDFHVQFLVLWDREFSNGNVDPLWIISKEVD